MTPQQADQQSPSAVEAMEQSSTVLSVVEATGLNFQVIDMPGLGQIAIAPGQHVAVHRVAIPTKSESQARRAAPFAIADDVATDVEALHVSIGPDNGSGTRLVGVVDQELMAAWAEALEQPASGGVALVPEQTLVQSAEDELVIIERGELIVAAYANGLGCVIERDVFPHLVRGICTDNEIRRIRIYSEEPDRLISRVDALPVEIDTLPVLSVDAYIDMLRAGADNISLDLLQGRYGPSVSARDIAKRWVIPLCASLVLGIAYLALVFVEGASLRDRAEQLDNETEEIAREALPGVTRIVNPRAQLEARLRSLQGSQGDAFLALTSTLFESLSRLQSGRLEALQFDSARLQLNATLSLRDYAEIEKLRGAIEGSGYRFQESSSRSEEGRITSDIQVGVP